MVLRYFAPLLALALLVEPAVASTLPRVDFKQSQTMVSLGLVDANVDYALSDRLSVGLSSARPFSLIGAGRVTYRLGEAARLTYGLTLSGGAFHHEYELSNSSLAAWSSRLAYWVQPTLNAALSLGSLPLTLRGTLGPAFINWRPIYWAELSPVLWFVPNVELAWRFHPNHELTLGGNSLVGWRGTFGGER